MKKNTSATKILVLGAGAVALAASSYYFFGPGGKDHRKKASGWMIRMKGEIIEKLEEAKDLSEETYKKIVDTVTASYMAAGKIAPQEVQVFADNLKGQWKHILKTLPGEVKKASKPMKKMTTKATKVIKKSMKKA